MTEVLEEHDDHGFLPLAVPLAARHDRYPTPRLMGYVYGKEVWDADRGRFVILAGNMSETVYSQAARLLKGEGFEQCALDYGELNGAVFYMLDEDLPFTVVYTQL